MKKHATDDQLKELLASLLVHARAKDFDFDQLQAAIGGDRKKVARAVARLVNNGCRLLEPTGDILDLDEEPNFSGEFEIETNPPLGQWLFAEYKLELLYTEEQKRGEYTSWEAVQDMLREEMLRGKRPGNARLADLLGHTRRDLMPASWRQIAPHYWGTVMWDRSALDPKKHVRCVRSTYRSNPEGTPGVSLNRDYGGNSIPNDSPAVVLIA